VVTGALGSDDGVICGRRCDRNHRGCASRRPGGPRQARPQGRARRRNQNPRRPTRSIRPHPWQLTSTPTLTHSRGAEFTRILSYGAARGDLSVPNSELVGPIDSSDEWIKQRTGIASRTRASVGILAVDLASDAAREAIEKSGIAPELIDLVIIAT